MKGRNLLILAVLAAVLAGVAVLTSRHKQESTPDIIGTYVLPDLPVNDVEKIVVYSAQSTATVARVDDVWLSPDRFNYPVDFEKVRDSLLKLAELKIGQVMRVDNNQRSRMKMISPPATSSHTGTLVELYSKGDTKLASVLIGESRKRKPRRETGPFGGYPDGQYVSPNGGKSVYLVTETLNDLSVNAKDWLNTDLVNITGSDIAEITIRGQNRKDVKLTRKKDGGDLEVEGLSKNQEADSSKVNSIESALSYLRFDDIADPTLTDEQLGMDKPVIFEAVTRKGEIYAVKIGASPAGSDNCYARIVLALKETDDIQQPAAASAKATAARDDGKVTAKEAAEERKQLEQEIRTLKEKLSKWTYLIASYKTDSMTVTRDELVKKKEKKKKEL